MQLHERISKCNIEQKKPHTLNSFDINTVKTFAKRKKAFSEKS